MSRPLSPRAVTAVALLTVAREVLRANASRDYGEEPRRVEVTSIAELQRKMFALRELLGNERDAVIVAMQTYRGVVEGVATSVLRETELIGMPDLTPLRGLYENLDDPEVLEFFWFHPTAVTLLVDAHPVVREVAGNNAIMTFEAANFEMLYLFISVVMPDCDFERWKVIEFETWHDRWHAFEMGRERLPLQFTLKPGKS